MTRIVRVPVYQGHPVPSRPHAPRGPFPPDLRATTGVNTDYAPQSDSGEPDLPVGATAQNGFEAVKYFRCRFCDGVLREEELDDHYCEGMNEQNPS